jgi:hypothetical protein
VALLQKLAPDDESALPPSELVAANALRADIPGFFSSSQFDAKLKKIVDRYRRSDIDSDSGERAA